jgi:glycosyltransferase involved in cell wall biosynthesis
MDSQEPWNGMTRNRTPKLIFLVTEDWYVCSHRLPMAKAAQRAGFEVGVATRVNLHSDVILAEGFSLYPLDWVRGSLSILQFIRAVSEVASLYRREKPDIVHHVSLKPVVIGSLAARLAGVGRAVNALTGLGYLFRSGAMKSRILRFLLGPVLKLALKRKGTVALLQNNDDRTLMTQLGFCGPNSLVIRGSGVDINHFQPFEALDRPIVTAAFVGRLIESKGVRVLIDAHQLLQKRGIRLKLLLAGIPDDENAAAISRADIARWAEHPLIEWLGYVEDVRKVWSEADIAVLPAIGGEGLPKSLLEAAACGRPIIATDIPGSREVAIAGRNAILVPQRDAEALSVALEHLAGSKELREKYGKESRRLVESDMANEAVAMDIVKLYRSLLEDDPFQADNRS